MNLEWQQDAACRGKDPDLFFTPDPDPQADLRAFAAAEKARVSKAEAICRDCPVTAACFRYAKAIGARDGIWAGTDLGRRLCRNRRHPMTPANTQRRSDGTTCCRACRAATDKRSRLRRQEEEKAA